MKVAVYLDGRLHVDGVPSSLPNLREALQAHARKQGVLWCYREPSLYPQPADSNSLVVQVWRAAVEANVPIRLTSRADYAEDSVYIQGEFRNSNKYLWTNGMTLADAIDIAGGLLASADQDHLQIRHPDGRIEVHRFSGLTQKRSGNPRLFPGDFVIAPQRKF